MWVNVSLAEVPTVELIRVLLARPDLPEAARALGGQHISAMNGDTMLALPTDVRPKDIQP